MKLARLWQPRKPAFWLVIVLNLLSALLAWIARAIPLAPWAAALLIVFATGNALFGLRLMWLLLRDPAEPAGQDPTPR